MIPATVVVALTASTDESPAEVEVTSTSFDEPPASVPSGVTSTLISFDTPGANVPVGQVPAVT